MKEITRTMLVSLVDKIEVSENKEITIYYKFNILNMGKEETGYEETEGAKQKYVIYMQIQN